MANRPRLNYLRILKWADDHYKRTGEWPSRHSGRVRAEWTESWGAIEKALMAGCRGIRPGDSISQLLMRERGRVHRRMRPRLSRKTILKWADAHHRRTGAWPGVKAGPIPEAPGETWCSVCHALRRARRGLRRTSLAALLTKHRAVRRQRHLSKLTAERILTFVLQHLERTGKWPTRTTGPIPNSGGETWYSIDNALRGGRRGVPNCHSLSDFLVTYFGKGTGTLKAGRHRITLPFRTRLTLKSLTEQQILRWARAHHRRTGSWPTNKSGPVTAAPGETWGAINMSLRVGSRGLRRGSSVATLLSKYDCKRNKSSLPPLSADQIVRWARQHYQRTGRLPGKKDRLIPDSGGETWPAVRNAAVKGLRGLPGTWSVSQLLVKRGVKRDRRFLPALTLESIRSWMIRHRKNTGRWPDKNSGAIPDAGPETWSVIYCALGSGARGLPKGYTLLRLAEELEVPRTIRLKPGLTHRIILRWARAFRRRNGHWPSASSGAIPGAPGENWHEVDQALRQRWRGIRRPTTLERLLRDRGTPA